MVARRAHNPEVRGSSPLSATRSEHRMHAARFIRAVSFAPSMRHRDSRHLHHTPLHDTTLLYATILLHHKLGTTRLGYTQHCLHHIARSRHNIAQHQPPYGPRVFPDPVDRKVTMKYVNRHHLPGREIRRYNLQRSPKNILLSDACAGEPLRSGKQQ